MKKLIKLKVFCLFLFISISTSAQKPAINHSVYDSWNNLNSVQIPKNGENLIYYVTPQEGDATLFIRNLKTGKTISVERASRAQINEEGTIAVATIKPLFKQTRAAKIKKVKREDMPKDTLAIIDLKTGDVKKYANYKSHNTPDKLSSFIAFELSPNKAEKAKADKAKAEKAKAEKADNAKADKAKAAKEPESRLFVMNINTFAIDTINNVDLYKFNKDGSALVYSTKPEKKDSLAKAAMFIYNPVTKESKEILSGPKGSKFIMPVFSKVNSMAFYANTDTSKQGKKDINIYLYNIGNGQLNLAVSNKMEGLEKGWIVSPNGRLSFSNNGQRLFFGTSPKPLEKDTSLVDFEQPQLDIWSWDADYNQPQQLLSRDRDLKRTYIAYINTDLKSNFVQLGTIDCPNVSIPNKQQNNLGLVSNDKKYRISQQWDVNPASDVYIMDIATGEQKLLLENSGFTALSYSPNGKYAIAYNTRDSSWYKLNIETEQITNLTKDLDAEFYNSNHDTPSLPSPYGQAIWFEDSEHFIIPDRFDYWKFDASGKTQPQMFTEFYGRKNNTRLNYIQIVEDEDNPIMGRFASYEIKTKNPVYFGSLNKTTKQTGLFIKDITKKNAKLSRLVEGPYTYSNFIYSKPSKGKKAAIAYTRGNFEDGTDLYVTYDNFKTEQRISDINPQKNNYNWGTVELVSWNTADGIPSEGLLFKPEDFDSTKKYPVIIYFYEKYSDDLYKSRNPAPSRSTVNIPFFVSNGYIVFVPDLYYKDGHPGKSAMRSLMPAVEMLEKNPWIDSSNMAIQGQSWGGYQVAYIITQTNKFKAAGAGAPVSNMTSAYGGIRWGSGMTRQFQYEQTQSRIGKNLWDGFDLYYENSPLFFAPNVTTPVLIMHNDKDGAVPWYQGIEFFTGLRRLGKVAWLLQYNNEEHNLAERRNAKDLSIRLEQFFNHYLKGAPMPDWMKNGRPAVKKGFDLGYTISQE